MKEVEETSCSTPSPRKRAHACCTGSGRWYPHFCPDPGEMPRFGLALPEGPICLGDAEFPRKTDRQRSQAQGNPSASCKSLAFVSPCPNGEVGSELTPAKGTGQLKCGIPHLPFPVSTLGNQVILIQQQKVMALPVTSCMNSSRFFNQSVLRFPHL